MWCFSATIYITSLKKQQSGTLSSFRSVSSSFSSPPSLSSDFKLSAYEKQQKIDGNFKNNIRYHAGYQHERNTLTSNSICMWIRKRHSFGFICTHTLSVVTEIDRSIDLTSTTACFSGVFQSISSWYAVNGSFLHI